MTSATEIVEMYRTLPPQDRQDARWFMSKQTMENFVREYLFLRQRVDALAGHNSFIFGIPVELDENLPYGVVHLSAESAFERSVRRLRAEGLTTVNVMHPVVPVPEIVPAPAPTLRALLRHWWKKVSRD